MTASEAFAGPGDESATEPAPRFLVFRLGGQRFALPFNAIDRVIRVVALTALPGAPRVIRGIFNLHGRIVPVADPRRRLGLPEREIDLSDRIVVTGADSRVLGLLIGNDGELVECPARAIVAADPFMTGATAINGLALLPDGVVLIHDLARFLSAEEESALTGALLDRR